MQHDKTRGDDDAFHVVQRKNKWRAAFLGSRSEGMFFNLILSA